MPTRDGMIFVIQRGVIAQYFSIHAELGYNILDTEIPYYRIAMQFVYGNLTSVSDIYNTS